MDVRSFKLRLRERHVRAVVGDGAGERGVDLGDDAAGRVFAAGAGLIHTIAATTGRPARALSVDVRERVVRVSLDAAGRDAGAATDAGARLDGPAFDALVPHVQAVARAIALELLPREPLVAPTVNDAAFWSGLWQAGRDGWEMGRPAPPIERWVRTEEARGRGLRGLRALVPGCGRGHEARLLARAGARVVAIDFAPEAVREARALVEAEGLAGAVEVRQADLFDLERGDERWDLVVEHTCFCAIDPARRRDYARVMATVLPSGGRLIGLFFAHGRPGGPPYSTNDEEILATFAPWFDAGALEVPPDSVATRLGQERLVVLTRR